MLSTCTSLNSTIHNSPVQPWQLALTQYSKLRRSSTGDRDSSKRTMTKVHESKTHFGERESSQHYEKSLIDTIKSGKRISLLLSTVRHGPLVQGVWSQLTESTGSFYHYNTFTMQQYVWELSILVSVLYLQIHAIMDKMKSSKSFFQKFILSLIVLVKCCIISCFNLSSTVPPFEKVNIRTLTT